MPDRPSLERLCAFLDEYPHVGLRVFAGYDGSITDLEFLRFFPRVRRVQLDLRYHGLTSTSGFAYLTHELEELRLGATKRKLDLAPLQRFTKLRTLSLEGHQKNIDVISDLVAIEDLELRSVTLPDLSLLKPLERLGSLDIKLGGTKDLRPLPEIGRIEYLELWLIRGLDDLRPISGMAHLRHLFLQELRQVKQLPDLSRCPRLTRMEIHTLKQLLDLRPLRTAPALHDLRLSDMPQLRWDQVGVLADHPTLQSLMLGTGSTKRNKEYQRRLGYPSSAPGT